MTFLAGRMIWEFEYRRSKIETIYRRIRTVYTIANTDCFTLAPEQSKNRELGKATSLNTMQIAEYRGHDVITGRSKLSNSYIKFLIFLLHSQGSATNFIPLTPFCSLSRASFTPFKPPLTFSVGSGIIFLLAIPCGR
jgi:hypothetical protein